VKKNEHRQVCKQKKKGLKKTGKQKRKNSQGRTTTRRKVRQEGKGEGALKM